MEDFLHRNSLSNRMCTAERRPDIDPKEVENFEQLLLDAHNDPEEKIIINADESQWRVVGPGGLDTQNIKNIVRANFA